MTNYGKVCGQKMNQSISNHILSTIMYSALNIVLFCVIVQYNTSIQCNVVAIAKKPDALKQLEAVSTMVAYYY